MNTKEIKENIALISKEIDSLEDNLAEVEEDIVVLKRDQDAARKKGASIKVLSDISSRLNKRIEDKAAIESNIGRLKKSLVIAQRNEYGQKDKEALVSIEPSQAQEEYNPGLGNVRNLYEAMPKTKSKLGLGAGRPGLEPSGARASYHMPKERLGLSGPEFGADIPRPSLGIGMGPEFGIPRPSLGFSRPVDLKYKRRIGKLPISSLGNRPSLNIPESRPRLGLSGPEFGTDIPRPETSSLGAGPNVRPLSGIEMLKRSKEQTRKRLGVSGPEFGTDIPRPETSSLGAGSDKRLLRRPISSEYTTGQIDLDIPKEEPARLYPSDPEYYPKRLDYDNPSYWKSIKASYLDAQHYDRVKAERQERKNIIECRIMAINKEIEEKIKKLEKHKENIPLIIAEINESAKPQDNKRPTNTIPMLKLELQFAESEREKLEYALNELKREKEKLTREAINLDFQLK